MLTSVLQILTSVLKTLVNDLKIKIIDKFYVKKSYFLLFQCLECTIFKK